MGEVTVIGCVQADVVMSPVSELPRADVQALDGGASWPDALAAATRFASAIVSRPSHERYRSEASR